MTWPLQIGGDQVAVTPLFIDPAADPHSFEPNAQAQLALSKAALVVQNGGGYDDFVQTMIGAAERDRARDQRGRAPSGKQRHRRRAQRARLVRLPDGRARSATRIADELTAIRPEQAAFFQANLGDLHRQARRLTARIAPSGRRTAARDVAVTEPVPLYLTEAAGLVNKTPEAFSAAIEEGTDVPPTVLIGHPGSVDRKAGRVAGDTTNRRRRRRPSKLVAAAQGQRRRHGRASPRRCRPVRTT